MIILQCTHCGSSDMRPATDYAYFFCNNCRRFINLWETVFAELKQDRRPSNIQQAVSETK